jgi:ATP-binding cassette subfamily C protein CydC
MANPKERSAVRVLLPYVGMMKSQARWIALGWLVSLITAIASIGLLALSGWFLTATALAGVTLATAKSFNYYTPGAGVRGFAIARTAGRYAERIVTHEATFRLLADLRVALYKAIEPLSLNQLSRFRSSDLLTRFVADIDALDNLYLRVMIPTLNAWVLSAVAVAVMSVWQPFAGVGLAVLLLLATVVIPLLFARLASKVSAQLVDDRKAFRDLWGEHIAALPEWISFNRMDDQKARLAAQEAKLAQTQLKMVAISCVDQTLMGVVSALVILILLIALVPAPLPELSVDAASITGPLWVMFVLAGLALFESVNVLPLAYQYLGQTVAAARRLDTFLSASHATEFGDQVLSQEAPFSLSIRDLTLSYPLENGHTFTALKSVDFELHAGDIVAVKGHSGSGKSSLIMALARFIEPESGQISLKGCPIESLSETALRDQMSVMMHPVTLFSGSVRDNLYLASRDLSDDAMIDALKAVNLWAELESAGGLDRMIGENGQQLSGGQRKRLALARSLLKHAPLLILDEPFEGVDKENAALIERNVLDWVKARQQAVLMISHHQHDWAQFDAVYQMEQGRLTRL